jgi:aerobic-type carbon monoxide dehydrogenase small subunit (CoxS/CutS family)
MPEFKRERRKVRSTKGGRRPTPNGTVCVLMDLPEAASCVSRAHALTSTSLAEEKGLREVWNSVSR